MSTKTSTDLTEGAGGSGSEPGGRAQRHAGGGLAVIGEAAGDRLADEVIEELLAGARTEEEIVGPGGVLAQLTKRLVERAMSAELSDHLGYEPHREPPGGVGQSWRDAWERVIPYFAFPPALRRAVYTTHQIESLNSVVRKAIRIRGHFPND